MAIEIPKEKWTGSVREVTIGATADQGGTRTRTVTIGGETALPFLYHEGEIPNPPTLAIEISDRKPDDWSPILYEAWGDAIEDTAAWAKGQLRILAEIADDRAKSGQPLNASYYAKELDRIQKGIEIAN